MAWTQYTDSMLAEGKLAHAAIIGIDGAVWAQSASCPLTADEAVAIAGGMGEASGAYLTDNGCTLGGTKYLTLRVDSSEGLYYGKKGASGICIARSTQTLVIGIYSEGMVPGDANVVTEGMKDHLVASQY